MNYDEETDSEEEEGNSLSSPSAHSEKESSVAGQKAASVGGAEPGSFCSWCDHPQTQRSAYTEARDAPFDSPDWEGTADRGRILSLSV